jgi:hypothetical protein
MYIDGVPYVEARDLGPEAVPYLLEIIDDETQRKHWVNAVVTIGFVASSEALAPLIEKLESAEGELDVTAFRGIASIPFTIGCIASNGDQQALDYLKAHLAPESWAGIKWTFRGERIPDLLVRQTIIGVAVSGHAQSAAILLDVRTRAQSEPSIPAEIARQQLELVDSALDTVTRLKVEGREGYFDGRREAYQ